MPFRISTSIGIAPVSGFAVHDSTDPRRHGHVCLQAERRQPGHGRRYLAT
jgi:hypothetical protein